MTLTEAAIAWWMSHRPIRWVEAQHLAGPRVNMNRPSEMALAEAVAAHIKELRKTVTIKHQFQVSSDKHTLWVNSGRTSMNLARFSSKGIDIHHDLEGQVAGRHCLFCKVGPDPMNTIPLRAEWELFKKMLKEHHGITVPKNIKLETRR